MMRLGVAGLAWSADGLRQFLANLWIYEVWRTIRPTYILLMADAARFLLLMAFLTLGHYVLGWVPVSEGRREFLEQGHFYVVTSAYIWFGLTLLAELVVDSLKRFRERLSKRNSIQANQSQGQRNA
jgi:hypothetical protein